MSSSNNFPLQRTIPRKRDHSPESSASSDSEVLADGCIPLEHSGSNPKKPWVLSSILFAKSVHLCMVLIFLLVPISLLTSGTLHKLRRAESQCSIPKWEYPNCSPYYANPNTPPLTPLEWHDLRKSYQEVVGVNASTLDPSWQVDDPTSQLNGFRVPVEVRTSPGKGRGVFLKAPVAKGQSLWDNLYTARFPDECSVRQFFDAVGEEAACSVTMWGYVNDFFGQGLQFLVDLDEGAYLNEAADGAEATAVCAFPEDLSDHHQLHNLTLLERRRQPGAFHIYAKRDLAAGTELLFEYSDVHIYNKLFWYDKLCFMTRGVWGWLTMQ